MILNNKESNILYSIINLSEMTENDYKILKIPLTKEKVVFYYYKRFTSEDFAKDTSQQN